MDWLLDGVGFGGAGLVVLALLFPQVRRIKNRIKTAREAKAKRKHEEWVAYMKWKSKQEDARRMAEQKVKDKAYWAKRWAEEAVQEKVAKQQADELAALRKRQAEDGERWQAALVKFNDGGKEIAPKLDQSKVYRVVHDTRAAVEERIAMGDVPSEHFPKDPRLEVAIVGVVSGEWDWDRFHKTVERLEDNPRGKYEGLEFERRLAIHSGNLDAAEYFAQKQADFMLERKLGKKQ